MASLLALGEFAFRVSRQDLATFAVVDPILALRGEQ
jgi:hypothetical protein